MKTIKRIIITILVASLCIATTATFVACDFNFGQLLEDAKWDYSDTGEAEIALNFAAMLADQVNGIYEWTTTKFDGTVSTTSNLVVYLNKTATSNTFKYVYTQGDVIFTVLHIENGNESETVTYYIDETNKTFTTAFSMDYMDYQTMIMTTLRFGIIQLVDEDNEQKWNFVEKRDSVSITNSSGSPESTVEYVYEIAELETGYNKLNMLVNFRKVVTPVIARIFIDAEVGLEIRQFTIFKTLHSETPVPGDFTVPTLANGYTNITP